MCTKTSVEGISQPLVTVLTLANATVVLPINKSAADFWFVTLAAQIQSEQLFNPTNLASSNDAITVTTYGNDAWCTNMVNTSAMLGYKTVH